MNKTKIQLNVTRIIEKYGGHKAWKAAVTKQMGEFNRVWDQDTDRIGRILRAHLAVEHFVTEFLSASNPNLGSLERARLSYAQKLDLLDTKDRSIEWMLPGLRHLGTVRNRVSHRLRVELTKADQDVFNAVELYRAMRIELNKRDPPTPIQDEVESAMAVLEDFARFASGLLHTRLDPNQHIWAEVLGEGDLLAEPDSNV
jgi:hypothetical protein